MIRLDHADKRPIYEQVTARFKELMSIGVLHEHAQLPSVRTLAVDLSINPNTIQRAYAELERQGYIYSIKGKGSFVAENERLRHLKLEEIRERIIEVIDEAHRLGMSDAEIMAVIEHCGNGGAAV